MFSYRQLPIKWKLTLIITFISSISVLLVSAAFFTYDRISYKDSQRNKLQALADVIGFNSISPLEFSDPQAAGQILHALKAEAYIVAARIYANDGTLFASYFPQGEDLAPTSTFTKDGYTYQNGFLCLFAPIISQDERLGTVCLQANLDELETRATSYVAIALLFLGVSTVITLLLASVIQRVISQPISNLAIAAREVSQFRDYSIRVAETSPDEIGDLIEGFNEMLGQIQARDASLRHSERYFRSLIENASEVITVADPEGKVRYVSPSIDRVFGYAASDVEDHSLFALLSPQDRNRVQAMYHWASTQPEAKISTEFQLLHGNGAERAVAAIFTNLATDEAVGGMVVNIQDITELKQAAELREQLQLEESKRRSERQFRSLIENSSDVIVVVDQQGKTRYISPSIERILGYTAGQVEDIDFFDCPQEGGEQLSSLHRRVADQPGQTLRAELRLQHADGRGRAVAAICTNLLKDEAVGGVVINIQDITEREQAAMQLAQAHKLESIGQLSAGIAHEINSPMQFVGDTTYFIQSGFEALNQVLEKYRLLLDKHKNGTVKPEDINLVEAEIEEQDLAYILENLPTSFQEAFDGIDRVRQIIQAMRDFSHPGNEEKVFSNLNQIIERATTLARNEWKYVADLSLDLDPILPQVPCLSGDISRVVVNLVVNAAHAVADSLEESNAEKGSIVISAKQRDDWVEVRVKDSGTGIPEQARPHIFVPFFTTKEVGKGTGQGLAIAHDVVVNKHGGTLRFETEAGQGTTFIMRLPLAQSANNLSRRSVA